MPKKIKDMQSFIGLAGYYRKFIENFSKIAKLLTSLTKKGITFMENGTTKCIRIIKSEAHNSTCTQLSRFREFLVTTDASDFAIGAVFTRLCQDRPIAYASRILEIKPNKIIILQKKNC